MKAVLTPRTGEIKAIKYGVFDIETAEKMDVFKCLGFYDGKDYIKFDCLKNFLEYILSPKYFGFSFYSHYGGGFDMQFIFKQLIEDEYKFTFFQNSSRLMLITVRKGKDNNAHWYFKDSYNLFPTSLEKAGNVFDVEHKKYKVEFGTVSDSDLFVYMKNDCLCLYECMTKYIQYIKQLNGNVKLTLASTALDIFCRNYLKTNLPTYYHLSDEIRGAYFGGRVEIFKLYGENLLYYDVNSMYPYVMQKYDMPTGNPTQVDKGDLNKLGYTYADILIPDVDIPIFPLKRDGKNIFPTGHIQGIYDNSLLKYAIEQGYNITLGHGIIFNSENIFREYVDTLYKIKQASQKGDMDYEITKLFLNSLYGKFGQKSEGKKNYIINPTEKEILGLTCYNDVYDIWEKTISYQTNFELPAIAAHVTTLAQIELHKLMCKCRTVFYCDTDCVFTDTKLSTGKNLGDLKLEAEISKAVFLLPKLYTYITTDNTVVKRAKGFTLEFLEQISFNNYYNALNGDLSAFSFAGEKFFKLKSALIQEGRFLYYGPYTKQLRSIYDKRDIIGFDTKPIYLS